MNSPTPKWDPIGFDNHSQMELCLKNILWRYPQQHVVLFLVPWNPHGTLVEPWWNPGGTLVEPYLRAAPHHPGAYLGRDPKPFSCWGKKSYPKMVPLVLTTTAKCQMDLCFKKSRGQGSANTWAAGWLDPEQSWPGCIPIMPRCAICQPWRSSRPRRATRQP